MAVQVASLFGLLSIKDEATDKLKTFRNGMTEAGSNLSGYGDKLIGVGAKITAFTAPLTLLGAKGVDVAATFEDSMAEIAARTGLTGGEMDKIRQTALQLGADTAFSAQQASDAFLQLLTSGQTAEQALQTLPMILTASAASGEDLGRTADVITDIMAAFGLSTADTGSVVETLAKAAGASSADMNSLGEGFANVGPVASMMGLNVADTAASLAIMSENGIKGAEAGTQLKSMLLNMARPTEEVKAAWNELGISLYDAQGNVRPLNVVLGEMKTALSSLPVQRQNELMQALAGSYGIVGLKALLGSTSIDQMQGMMRNSAGAAEVAEAKMNTLHGRFDALGGSLETLAITVFTPFNEMVLKPMAEKATDVVNAITDWAKANPEAASTLLGIGAALILVGPGLTVAGFLFKGLGTVVSVAGTAAGLLRGAMIALGAPVIILVGTIGALIAVMGSTYPGGWPKLMSDAATTARQLAILGLGVLAAASGWCRDRLNELLTTIRNVIQAIKDFFAQMGQMQTTGGIIPQGGVAPVMVPNIMSGGFAEGGDVYAGRRYRIGERGEEDFVAPVDGTIIPNHELGDSGGMTFNAPIYVYANNPAEFAAQMKQQKRRLG